MKLKLKHTKQTGFTLMEVLVVLVLISLITTSLMQGLSYFLKLKSRSSTLVLTQQQEQLQAHWFKILIQGITPYQSFANKTFLGVNDKLQGQTLTTLTSATGIIAPISLTLKQEVNTVTLLYKANEKQWSLGKWTSKNAYFTYQDKTGEQHSSWPPSNKDVTPLPSLIHLHITTFPKDIDWYVSIAGRLTPKPILQDFL